MWSDPDARAGGFVWLPTQAQGLALLLGGVDAVASAVSRHNVLLAAHGPYTAAGVSSILNLPVTCVSSNFSSFAGLVSALEARLA